MLWFLTASTLLLASALLMPATRGGSRRRILEVAVLLVPALPLLRGVLAAAGMEPPLMASWDDSASPLLHAGLPAFVWLAGFAVNLVRLMLQARSIGGLRRSAEGLPAAARSHIASVLGISAAATARHFYLSARILSPMALPTVPGVVLLPADWADWPPRLQACALRHEWHHLRHGDALWSALIRLFLAALWFHPLAWFFARCWNDECEHAADRAAVGSTGSAADYAADLLNMAAGAPPALALGIFTAAKGRLRRRIEVLFRPTYLKEQPAAAPVGSIGLVIVLAFACAWCGLRQNEGIRVRQDAQMRLRANPFPADP